MIHIGHVRFLEAARQKGDELVVALESDEFIRHRKHREPFHTQSERAEILGALESVDVVIMLPLLSSSKEYAQLVEKVKPSIIAISENDPQEENKRKQAKEHGATVEIVTPIIPQKSSSAILDSNPHRSDIS